MAYNEFSFFPVDAVLLLGPTGVGKSPLGDAISARGLFSRRCHHLDFGSELRAALSGGERSSAFSAAELDFIFGVLDRGLLLENEHFPLARKIISLFLDRSGFSRRDLLLLNGIPRHAGQARDVASIARIHSLVVLDCSAKDVFCRIRDNAGGDRSKRIDDTGDLIEKKLLIFQERTAPLIEHYEKSGSALYRIGISGTTTAGQAYEQLLLLSAAHPPFSLVAEPPS